MFSNKLYDSLKSVALIWLPALTTLYFAVASIWGIPDTANVIGTMTVVDTFLGTVLGVSAKAFGQPTDGALVLNGTGLQTLQIPLTVQELSAKDTITLKVNAPKTSPSTP